LPRAELCETCRYWRPYKIRRNDDDSDFERVPGDEQFDGRCHRYPPRLFVWPAEGDDASKLDANFPNSDHLDWCGEWRAKGGGPEDRYQEFLGKLSVRACRNLSESRRSAYYFMDGIRYPPITSFEQLLATPPPIVRDRKGIGPTSLLQIYDTLKDMNVPLSGLWDRPRDKFHLGGLSGLEAHREK
jgi:hypothetical protein